MNRYLGLKLTHDAAVALVEDGKLVFSIELEKINNNPRYAKVQHWEEVNDILSTEHVQLKDLRIVIDGWKQGRINPLHIDVAPYHEHDIHHTESCSWGDLLRARETSAVLNGIAHDACSFTHTTTHIIGSYAMSPWAAAKSPCNVIVWDGGINPRVYRVNPGSKKAIQYAGAVHELYGMIYGVMGYYWGPFKNLSIRKTALEGKRLFGERDWPGKLMAYIALGNVLPELMEDLGSIYKKQVKALNYRWLGHNQTAILEHAICQSIRQQYKDEDVLATIHQWLTNMLVEQAKVLIPAGERLIFTGGSALNIKWNSALRDSNHFSEVFVTPVANDSGNAIGAACAGAVWWNDPSAWTLEWGEFSGPKIAPSIPSPLWSVKPATADSVAQLLVTGAPVICLNGRAEIGPRALGARSILMHPGSADTKDFLNHIKGRESWRPVAPMILAEHEENWFSPRASEDFYMLFDHTVLPQARQQAPAILHLDGTARVQVVKEGFVKQVLQQFYKQTGIPVLCNTSANLNGSGFFPSVRSAMDWAEQKNVNHIYCDGVLYDRNH